MKLKLNEGFFLVLESPTGSGKSTLLTVLLPLLQKRFGSDNVVLTQEPWKETSTVENRLEGKALLDYVVADRRAHLHKLVLPSLTARKIVVSSRYYPSALVYQWGLDNLLFEECWEPNKDFRTPDLTVFLTAAPEVIAARIAARPNKSRFEQKSYHQAEQTLYLRVADFLETQDHSILRLDSAQSSPKELAEQLMLNLA